MASNYKEKVKASADLRKRDILMNNFLGGLAWGLGTVVGATVIVAIVGTVLNGVGAFDPFKAFIDTFKYTNQLFQD